MSNAEKKEAYQSAVMTAAMCAQLLGQHDIPQLLRDIERADAFGPILDPTMWRDRHQLMDQDRELLEAANVLRTYAAKRAAKVPK